MGSVNVLSENEKLHIIGKVQGVEYFSKNS